MLTAPVPFLLYREESVIYVTPWAGSQTPTHPFGNDDKDPTRGMVNSSAAAARAGGGLS